jgi:hypothetical protein
VGAEGQPPERHARSNAHYGIPERNPSGNGSKAKTVDATDLDKVRDPHVRISLELQRAFGLRREEAIKFSPGYADKGDYLLLKASWTKGGKARTIPVRTPEQWNSAGSWTVPTGSPVAGH